MRAKRTTRRFWLTAGFLLSVHLLGLLMLSLFRGVQLAALFHLRQSDGTPVWPALLRGVWFDNVVACYLMVLPLVVVLLAACANRYGRPWRRAASGFLAVGYVCVFAISAANIPYFQYFFKNLNSSIFNWFGYATTTAGMLVGETSYLVWFALFALVTVVYVLAMKRLRRRADRLIAAAPADSAGWQGAAAKLLPALLLIGACAFGIRGRVGYNPIKVSQAYYCNDPFLNQLGIAPAYNLLTSVMDDMRPENEELHLMGYGEAITLARQYYGIGGAVDSAFVMRRTVNATAGEDSLGATAGLRLSGGQPRNVVIILMESMSAALMKSLDGRQVLTPVLDSLMDHSLAFTRCYSAGIHTNHGITASLYSFPAMMKRNLMKGTVTPHRAGLPTVLHDAGYQTLFFMTHEAQYDNMNAFLRTNGYDDVYAQEDYPAGERVNAFGVPDRFLFSYALPVISQKARQGKPFLATLLTVSNHPPYVVPEGFPARSTDEEWQIVEYADRCIGEFLQAARREPWYENTLFVVMADHGKLVGTADAELPQSYNHIPLLMFGAGLQPQRYDGLATQTDVMPTVLGLLGCSYSYDGFGIDLLRQRHDMVCYTADDVIAARDASRLFLYKPATGQTFCYAIGGDGALRLDARQEGYGDLRRYAFAIIQTAEYIEKRNKASL